ncbi:MAG: hypothetical protein MUF44_14895 [Hydrogenophaga sp.]|nr:hypothetical protein [Hydrogenophaga sp.]
MSGARGTVMASSAWWRDTRAHATGERAATGAPQPFERAGRVARRVLVGHRPHLFTAALRVATLEADAVGIFKARPQGTAPVAAACAGERHGGVNGQARQRRFAQHARHASGHIGLEGEDHRLEVHQQRVGGGVVGAQAFAVELGRVLVRHLERAVVEHDVAQHHLNAFVLQRDKRRLDALQHQLGVAAAAHIEVAAQGAAADLAGGAAGPVRSATPAPPAQTARSAAGRRAEERC